MASEIVDLFTNGTLLDVDLLLVMPVSSDKRAWKLPQWKGYKSVAAPVQLFGTQLPGGLSFQIFAPFQASEGIWRIEAFAASYQGFPLFFGPLNNPSFATPQSQFPLNITGIVNPVQS